MIVGRILIVALLLAVLGHVQRLEAATLTVAWDHSPDEHVAGYLISYGTESGRYTTSVKAGLVTQINLTGLVDGAIYYFSVQSFDSSGAVGPPSSEATGRAPSSSVTISCPSPVLTSADGKSMSVTLTATVTGGVPPMTSTCSPASGSLFPVGSTSFKCTVADALQRQASCTSAVVIMATSLLPSATSPNGTAVPPASQIVDAQLLTWTLGGAVSGAPGNLVILRNGQPQGDYAASLLWYGGQLYAGVADGHWFRWTGADFVDTGTTKPGGSTPAPAPGGSPSPSGTAVPPASQVVDGQLVTWTLGAAVSEAPGNLVILRNGQPQGDYAASLLWYGGQLYAGVTDGHWFRWNGADFVDTGTTKPGGSTPPQPTSPTPAPALTLSCPQIAPVTATSNSGAIVTFANPVFSGGTAPVTISCTPRSGSQFGVGTTTVSCQAADSMAKAASCTTSVRVLAPSPAPPQGPAPPLPLPSATSPNGTAVPPAPQIIDAQLVTWTLGAAVSGAPGNLVILRNGQPQGDYAASLLWYGGQLYAGVTNGHWFRWTGADFVDTGTTKPGGSTPAPGPGPAVSPSQSGTAVPPAPQIVDSQIATWTLGAAVSQAPGNFAILRNGQPQGDYAASLLWYGGQLYANVTDGHWFRWTGSNFVDIGTARPSSVTVLSK